MFVPRVLAGLISLLAAGLAPATSASNAGESAAAATPPPSGFVELSVPQTPALNRRQRDAEAVSLDFLRNHMATDARMEAGSASDYDYVTRRVEEDTESHLHTHVQQMYRGVPVFGGEAIVHLEPDEYAPTLTDDLMRGVNVNTTPNLTSEEALRIATRAHGCTGCYSRPAEIDLWVLRRSNRDRLVYRVQLFQLDGSANTSLPVFFINAHSGRIVNRYNNLQTGTGRSLYSGRKTINTFFVGATPATRVYYLEDRIRNVGIYDGRSTTNNTFFFTDPDNNFDSANQRAGVDAHFGTSSTLDYFKSKFNRNGLDGRGGPGFFRSVDNTANLKSVTVHYGNRFNNGFWDRQRVVLGDGDGVQNGPNVSVDWLGHEWTHALTQYTADLVYQNESGALNESISDVFGAMIERHAYGENNDTWRLFEKTLTPRIQGDAERNMASPHLGRSFIPGIQGQPDHYTERYLGSFDNGGVHVNSGIPNKAFHLLAKGGSHHRGGSMTGIGPDAAAKIWFRALTTGMTRTTNFKGARTATLNAARALHGLNSTQYNAVARSWALVGVN